MATKKSVTATELLSTTTLVVSLLLKDGTALSCRLNGTTYESDTVIDKSVLSEDNLSEVTIDGEKHTKMVLVSYYDYNGGTRFALRDQTEEEKTFAKLEERLQDAETSALELSELVASMSNAG